MKLSRDLSLTSRPRRTRWDAPYVRNGTRPRAVADYVNERFGGAKRRLFEEFHDFSRSSGAWLFDATGTAVQVGADQARLTAGLRDETRRGLLLETGRRNELLYSNMSGAVPGTLGSGGALPMSWGLSGIAQSALTIESVSLMHGLPHLKMRLKGTPQATIYIFLASATAIPANANQTWKLSAWAGVAAGSLTNVSAISLHASGWTSTANYVGGSPFSGPDFSTQLGAEPVLFDCEGSLSGAQIERIRPALRLNTSGDIDLTLDLLLPMATHGRLAFAGLPAGDVAAVQSADSLVITGVDPGSYDVVIRSEGLGESVHPHEQVDGAYWPQGLSDDIVQSVCFYPPGSQ